MTRPSSFSLYKMHRWDVEFWKMQVVRDCRTIRSRQSSIVANKGDNADARQVDWSCFPSQTANCASPNGKESRKWPTSQKTFLKTVYFFKARSINVWQKQREQNATHAAPKALLDVAPVQTVPVKVGCVPLMVNAGWYVRRLPIVLPNDVSRTHQPKKQRWSSGCGCVRGAATEGCQVATKKCGRWTVKCSQNLVKRSCYLSHLRRHSRKLPFLASYNKKKVL